MNDDKNIMLTRDENRATLDRLFESVFGDHPFYAARAVRPTTVWSPAVDIRETDSELIVYAAVPGLDKGDVGLEVKENTLVINGRMRPLGSDEDAWVRRELPRGEFYRAFALPTEVDSSKVRATMKHGVLEIRLPKAEQAKPRKIEIE